MKRRQLLLLAAAVTDSTFERTVLDGQAVWVGKCIHCGAKLVVRDDGWALGKASLEHVWPSTQGGTEDIENLAVACAGCNREKGVRHDRRGGQRLEEVVAVLRERRAVRWRDPREVGMQARLRKAFMLQPSEP